MCCVLSPCQYIPNNKKAFNMNTQNTSLETLVATLQAQEKTKKDYIAHPGNIFLNRGNLTFFRNEPGKIDYTITDYAHSQLAEKLNIPKKYYDRMRSEAVDLLDSNANHWLKQAGKGILIRTFEQEEGNVARAFLSDRFGMIDNYEVLFEALEAIKQTGITVDIVGAELSDKKMYLKAVCPEIEVEAKELLERYARTTDVGTGIISGFTLSNSEVGAGAFNIMARAMVLACRNGLVRPEDALRRTHLGGKMDQLDFASNSAVRAANSKLIKEQVKVAVQKFLSKDYLKKLVEKYTNMGKAEIVAPIANVIEVVARDYQISADRKVSILDHFIRGGDKRRMGIVNAITEECQTLKDIDLKNESETVAFDVLKNFESIEKRAFTTEFTTN